MASPRISDEQYELYKGQIVNQRRVLHLHGRQIRTVADLDFVRGVAAKEHAAKANQVSAPVVPATKEGEPVVSKFQEAESNIRGLMDSSIEKNMAVSVSETVAPGETVEPGTQVTDGTTSMSVAGWQITQVSGANPSMPAETAKPRRAPARRATSTARKGRTKGG